MIKVEIEYNPFIVHTTFKIEDVEIAEDSFLSKYASLRLQDWIDDFAEILYSVFNKNKQYDITFTGTKEDCDDVAEAVEYAVKNNSFDIKINYKVIKGAESRLTEIENLVKEAEKSKLLSKYINASVSNKTAIKEAFNKDFDAFVVATMSSGKSTFINSLLGYELLPAANEATTATIAQINNTKDQLSGVFNLQLASSQHDKRNNLVVDFNDKDNISSNLKQLSDWNAQGTSRIRIDGNLIGIENYENSRLVLTDTPGPNNSRTTEHRTVTIEHIQDSNRNPLILYIINATQIGTDDDMSTLNDIANAMQKKGKQGRDRFLFLLNKADEFDLEKENMDKILLNVKNYLSENGIAQPKIYPISAQLALLLRKQQLLEESLSSKEKRLLQGLIGLFEDEKVYDFVQYMPLNRSELALMNRNVASMSQSVNPLVLERSGIPAIEAVVSNYINKYNLPNRVYRIYGLLSNILKDSNAEAQINANLNLEQSKLDTLKKELVALEKKKRDGFDVKQFITRLEEREAAIPDIIVGLMHEEQSDIDNILEKLKKQFVTKEKVSVASAYKSLEKLEKIYTEFLESFHIKLESIEKSSQPIIQKQLIAEYNQYLESLFGSMIDDKDIFPILDGLKIKLKNSMNGAFIETLQNNEIKIRNYKQKRERTVQERNPWTLWITKRDRIEEYEIDVKEEFVDLESLWAAREHDLYSKFEKQIKILQEVIGENSKEMSSIFAEYAEKHFNPIFDNVMSDLNSKMENVADRERAIQEGRNNLDEIKQFQDKLSQIISMNR
ncbi:hypothetical protein DC083_09000 [Ignatzschineria ureiclastica]|uniref:Dynamin N-terminal domain-containing protein n=1 Tax=Ignatzschineria ureiclastica TaxID=472582 RepID=A0A2U2ACR0_9GAMM|nr:dynamin family protein [Ignatzschineria ureiclastica]PWD80441.1 hypothetical protein DC083_09000 [Ignatzschineria ureiclastica]GGZ99494.1 hypothetical protein GCM10007162_14540 [Ignatzschineria ureiclastica]